MHAAHINRPLALRTIDRRPATGDPFATIPRYLAVTPRMFASFDLRDVLIV